MWKSVVAGTLALGVAASSLAYAQQQRQQGPDRPGREVRARLTTEDFQAFTDAHIAALKAGLKLSADQEKNWPPVEAAIRDLAKQREGRMEQRRAQMQERRGGAEPRDAIALLRNRADTMTERAAGLKKLADAAEPLYKSLDDGQKRRLRMLAWSARERRDGFRARAERL